MAFCVNFQLAPEISVEDLPGVGPDKVRLLERLNLLTIRDLLNHCPRRYEDRRSVEPIDQLSELKACSTRGSVVALGVKTFRQRRKSLFELILQSGEKRLHCRWWNQAYRQNYFQVGDELYVHGKLRSLKPLTMDHPETEIIEGGELGGIHVQRIVPIYPLTEGLHQRWLRTLMWNLVEDLPKWLEKEDGVEAEGDRSERPANPGNTHDVDPSQAAVSAREGKDAQPADRNGGAMSRCRAFQLIHFPEELEDIETARRRLAKEEYRSMLEAMLKRRARMQGNAPPRDCRGDNRLIRPFLDALPFSLTEAQRRVLKEIRSDLGKGPPMRRLLQGDVGSGKTVVAALTALMTIESGYNAVLMAPTEILAEQHGRTFREWFHPLGVSVFMRTGSLKEDDRANDSQADFGLHPGATSGGNKRRLIVGTHALVESAFQIDDLGLAIIDEQHKFGVRQREDLVRKGDYPHLLVMTATPIPRTLGLTLYGDLDISLLDQMPEGRGVVRTYVRTKDRLPKVWDFIRDKLKKGRQVYVVYPQVEESEQRDVKAVVQEWDYLKSLLKPYAVGLMHGRMKSEEKDSTMESFRRGDSRVLLSTSVIEVGVDVPNASILLVENAEQFGLIQLHQLRGRIGRGNDDAYCILIAELKTEESERRLQVMASTSDGFRIAEEDLALRGPGDFLGKQQSGLPPLVFGKLEKDLELIQEVKRELEGTFGNKTD